MDSLNAMLVVPTMLLVVLKLLEVGDIVLLFRPGRATLGLARNGR